MQEPQLIAAATSDIPAISALAGEIWNEYYPAIISRRQIRYMLKKMYSHESLNDQMKAKGHIFYFIKEKSKIRGFLSVVKTTSTSWHLNKFYIIASSSGKGLGLKAFTALLRLLKITRVTLTVNRQNYKAINFYFKCGFRISRVADFDIGGGYVMNDFVMKWGK